MHSKSDNIEIMIIEEADEVIKNFLIHKKIDIKIIYNQWEVMILSWIMFSCFIINVNRGESYKDSPEWIKNIKTMINPVSKKYAVTVALNDEETEKDLQKITKIKLFTIGKEIFHQQKMIGKKFEKNIVTTASEILHA